MAQAFPIVFRRNASSRLAGCLVYAIGVPAAALVLAGLVYGLIFAALHVFFKLGETPALIAALFPALGIIPLILIHFIREYRRRARSQVSLWDDRLELEGREGPEVLAYADLEEIEYFDVPSDANRKLIIRGSERRGADLDHTWPLHELAEALAQHAVPIMVERWWKDLDRGGSLIFKERLGRALLVLGVGILLFGFGAFLLGGHFFKRLRESRNALPGYLHGIGCVLGGGSMIVWFIRSRRGGVLVSKSGLRALSADFGPETPWSDIQRVKVDDLGLRLEGGRLERPIKLSKTAPNFLVLLSLVRKMAGGKAALEG